MLVILISSKQKQPNQPLNLENQEKSMDYGRQEKYILLLC